MAIRPPLKLNRSELSKFLSDPESIKQFERLFFSVESIVEIVPVTETPAVGDLLIGNGSGFNLNLLGAGTGIGVLNTPGNITVVNNGVLSIIAGTGISASSGTGNVTVANTGVLSFSAGTTGFTPSTDTTGAVTLAGILGIANGGTNATNATDARFNLSAAILGANDDITSMSALTGGIETPTYVQMDVTAVEVAAMGKFNWNPTDQTLDVGMDYGVVQQIGQEQYARVGNTTGVTIPNGTVVGFAGAMSDAILVEPYLADGVQPTLYILGVMTHDLPDSGQKGYCTTFGFVRGIDTSAFAAGDILYASPTVAGAFTNVKPTAPDNVIVIAACIVSDATNGVVFVRPTIKQMKYYGVFVKTTDQSPVTVNTEALLTFDSTEISNGVLIGTPTSRIVVPESGLYRLDASIQLSSGSSSVKNVWFWIKKNGTAIPNSSRIVTSDINNGYIPITLGEPVSLAASDYIEIAFAADDINVTVDSVPATAFAPVAPAVVLSVTEVQQ
jgi:hypothetical protein